MSMLGKHAASLVGRVSGMGVGGTTGEYYALSFDERVKTFDTVAQAVGGKTYLTAGINATTTKEVCVSGRKRSARAMTRCCVAAPYYAQPTQDELLAAPARRSTTRSTCRSCSTTSRHAPARRSATKSSTSCSNAPTSRR